MSDLQGSGPRIDQGGDWQGGGIQRGGRRATSRRSGSRLAGDELLGSEGPGLESSSIDLKIEEILVLSAYSDEVILNNPRAFKIKSRRLIAWIYAKIISATIYARTAVESSAQGRREVVERELVNLR